MTLMECCREEGVLHAVQIELLKRIAVCFPLVADLAYACVRCYIMDAARSHFVLAAQELPSTVIFSFVPMQVGEKFSLKEEPMLKAAFESGKIGRGKREWDYGSMMDMRVFPVIDNGNTIAVITLEMDMSQQEGSEHLLKTAEILLEHARKPLDAELYRHISPSDGVIIADRFRRIVFADMAAVRIYRVLGVGSLVGLSLSDRKLTRHVTKETLRKERPWEKELEAGGLVLLQKDIHIQEGGNSLCHVIVLSDLTEIRRKDKEIRIKSAVIQEIHHRVKNNLQTIASLLRLQARRSDSEEVKAALKESVNRILSISVVHEFLSQQGDEKITVDEIMNRIFTLVARTMSESDFHLETEIRGEKLTVPARYASPLALVLNELVLNAMEHAFVGRKSGRICLTTAMDEAGYSLKFTDDGVGLPRDFQSDMSKSLGLQIVRTLVEGDMEGEFSLKRGRKIGTEARILIPRKES